MHLVIAKYSSDAERKKIEYVLDKWREKLRVIKPEGIVSIVDGDGIAELVEELYSRTSKGKVSVYRIEEEAVEVEKGEKEIALILNEEKEIAGKLIGFVMAKQKAILKRERKEPLEKVYELVTKKGNAEVSVTIRDEGRGVGIRMRITGYGEAVEFLYGRLTEELKYLEGKGR